MIIETILNFLKRSFIVMTFSILSVTFVFFALYFYWDHFKILPLSSSVEAWGQFGDYVGGVLNPGLSFLSIILVCITLFSTSRQSSVQSFESILFELVKYHKENLLDINVIYEEVGQPDKIYHGKECLKWFMTEIKFHFLNISDDEKPDEIVKKLSESVDYIYTSENNFTHLGHYFRNLYHIFKHIDEANFLTKNERVKYSKLIRAQLSSIESGALFFNGLSTQGNAFKIYIERYSLLQGFVIDESISRKIAFSGNPEPYKKSAFKDIKL
ncbi:putative phage abortive infection protein [Rahnella aceris]|uniref:putative phage abortive infection protein n=1 Tax=Rahnella sp. (strain Y9602) TaxID=2703885 RepID=UPI003FD468E9